MGGKRQRLDHNEEEHGGWELKTIVVGEEGSKTASLSECDVRLLLVGLFTFTIVCFVLFRPE